MQPLELTSVVTSLPVFAHTIHVAGNKGALSAFNTGLDTALLAQVAQQVALMHVGPVAAGPRTFILTSVRKCGILRFHWFFRLEGVRFVRTVASPLGLSWGISGFRGMLRFSCN